MERLKDGIRVIVLACAVFVGAIVGLLVYAAHLALSAEEDDESEPD